MPDKRRAGAQVRCLILGVAQAGEAGFGGHAFVDKHLRRGVLKPAQQLRHRLVLLGNAGNRHRARDDADLVSRVALILRLPQRVLAKPHLQVPIQRRHPRHRLRVGVVQANPPGSVARGNLHRARLRVLSQQLIHATLRLHLFTLREERDNFAVIGLVQTCLDALQQRDETLIPAAIHKRRGQLNEALHPLRVRHLLNVAEVRLRGLRQRLDDLLAVRLILLNIQRGDQARSLGKGIIQIVQVRQQVRLGRRHTADPLATADPAAVVLRRKTWGIHQQLLDGIGGLRLLRSHGDRTHKYAVYRHLCQAELLRPATGEELSGALRRVHATTNGEYRVVVRADLRVGFQQHLFQVNPGVVAARVAVLHHQNHGIIRVGLGNLQGVANLLRGAGLESDVREAVCMQLREQLRCLLNLRDACGDAHAVKRCARRTRLGHHAGLAELQVPQEAVKEHGVELRGTARLQEADKVVLVLGELFLRVHAAAGKLRPVAGVGGRGDDLAIRRGRRHAAQDDRGQARQRRKTRLRVGLAVRQGDHARGILGVVHCGRQRLTRAREGIALA